LLGENRQSDDRRQGNTIYRFANRHRLSAKIADGRARIASAESA
jgi:hypothetical protein